VLLSLLVLLLLVVVVVGIVMVQSEQATVLLLLLLLLLQAPSWAPPHRESHHGRPQVRANQTGDSRRIAARMHHPPPQLTHRWAAGAAGAAAVVHLAAAPRHAQVEVPLLPLQQHEANRSHLAAAAQAGLLRPLLAPAAAAARSRCQGGQAPRASCQVERAAALEALAPMQRRRLGGCAADQGPTGLRVLGAARERRRCCCAGRVALLLVVEVDRLRLVEEVVRCTAALWAAVVGHHLRLPLLLPRLLWVRAAAAASGYCLLIAWLCETAQAVVDVVMRWRQQW